MIRRDCIKQEMEEKDGYVIWRFWYADGTIEFLRMRSVDG